MNISFHEYYPVIPANELIRFRIYAANTMPVPNRQGGSGQDIYLPRREHCKLGKLPYLIDILFPKVLTNIRRAKTTLNHQNSRLYSGGRAIRFLRGLSQYENNSSTAWKKYRQN